MLALFYLLACSISVLISVKCEDQIPFMNTTHLVRLWGLPVETHEIITEDGYILTVHRIPNDRSSHQPLLFSHGVFSASDVWVLRGSPDLVIRLARKGFDIWLLNNRGNFYSKKHKTLSARDKKFWKFGFHEIGLYDMSATIDYILEKSGRRQVVHIGHSMGNTCFFALVTSKPEYNQKIQAHISLAPTVFMRNIRTTEGFRPYFNTIEEISRNLESVFPVDDIFQRRRGLSEFWIRIMSISRQYYTLVLDLFFYIMGPDYTQLTPDIVRRILGHVPSGASFQMLYHYKQIYQCDEFVRYNATKDQCLKENVRPYDLSLVTSPVYIYYSIGDFLSDAKDVKKLAGRLKTVVRRMYLIPHKYFNHFDYLWAKDAGKFIYDDVIKVLESLKVE